MKKCTLLFAGMLFLLFNLQAQEDAPQPPTAPTPDSKKEQTIFNQTDLRITGGWGTSTTSLSFFDSDFAVVTGGYGGVEISQDFFIGWGGFSMVNDFKIDRYDNNRFDLEYNGLMLGYAPKSFQVLHPKFLVLGGGGKINQGDRNSDNVFVIQPSAGVEINVLRWFRIGLDAGYRFVTDTDFEDLTDADVSAPFGEVTFKFGWSWGE